MYCARKSGMVALCVAVIRWNPRSVIMYTFGDCQLDLQLYVLYRAGHTIRQRPKVFQVLAYLLAGTSAESARARGEDLAIGGKAILLKVGESFKLFVLSADRILDSARVKGHFKAKKLRFATTQELLDLTGLVPGSLPPFGKPITPFALFVDPSVTEKERIAFNAGSLTDSIVMQVADYLKVAEPQIIDFAKTSPPGGSPPLRNSTTACCS